jgi:PEP-CTERM motif
MSWKRLLAASLLCIVASPALADPGLTVVAGPDVGGNKTWNVTLTPNPVNTPLALELGFQTLGGNFVSVVSNPAAPSNGTGTPTTPIEFFNPGNFIFGWETPTAAANNKPVGIQIGAVGAGAANHADEAFVALGTNILNAAAQILTITAQPSVTSLVFGGNYSAAGVLGTPGFDLSATRTGRIAQLTTPGGTVAQNYHGFQGNVPAGGGGGFIDGDFDGSHAVGAGDLNLVLNNWASTVPPVPAGWIGKQPPNGQIGAGLLNEVLNNWGNVGGAGSGSVASIGAVPEPTTLVLIGLALAAAGLVRRREVC